jgi:hypothetical protein
MNVDEPIVLYIVLRQSLQLNKYQTAHFTADAVQQLLIRYFTLQVLAVKTGDKLASVCKPDHLNTTTMWLGAQSPKRIVSADEDTWAKIKSQFALGMDLLCVKEKIVEPNTEAALVFWPTRESCLPNFITELTCT